MTYLKTPTQELSTYQIRKIVGMTISWAKLNLGTKQKFRTLKYRVLTQNRPDKPYFGDYHHDRNTIRIYKDNCPTVKHVIMTTLHEYTHFLQNLRTYDKILKTVGYKLHPLEIEAVNSERYYSDCWADIKNNI